MKNNIKGVLNYVMGLLILYGMYVNTGGFFNISIFYIWAGTVILFVGNLVVHVDNDALYEMAKDMPKRSDLYHFGLNVIDALMVMVLVFNAHYFYAIMVVFAWLMAESLLKKIRNFDIQKYEESQKWIAGLFKDIDDGIKKS